MASSMISVNVVRGANEKKDHHLKPGTGPQKASRFQNPWPSYVDIVGKPTAFFTVLRHWDWSSYWKTDVPPPQVKPDWTPSTKLVGHWLAHASVLIEFPKTAAAERGVRVLCDPIWSTRCSPSSLVGPKRFTDSPINDDQPLPEVDLVVLSHNHYDHTDVPTLQKIYKSQPKGSLHFLELLLKEVKVDPSEITEADWWDHADISINKPQVPNARVTVHSVPSQHVCNRGLYDKNACLWSAWAFQSEGKVVYFGGDTGYCSQPLGGPPNQAPLPPCPAFEEAGTRLGPFDLSFIPIGAWSPAKVFSGVHASPKDAVCIHQDIRSKKSVVIYHSTWRLTDEPINQPREDLVRQMEAAGLPADDFVSIPIGARVEV